MPLAPHLRTAALACSAGLLVGWFARGAFQPAPQQPQGRVAASPLGSDTSAPAGAQDLRNAANRPGPGPLPATDTQPFNRVAVEVQPEPDPNLPAEQALPASGSIDIPAPLWAGIAERAGPPPDTTDPNIQSASGPLHQGVAYGDWTITYTNGNYAKGPYVLGKKHGTWQFFDQTGTKYLYGPIRDGVPIGIWQHWNFDRQEWEMFPYPAPSSQTPLPGLQTETPGMPR